MAQGFTRGTPIDTDPNLALDSDLVVPSQKAIKDYVDTGLSNKVNRSGDTMAGNLILNVNPTLPLQAATKDYVDTLINGLDWKQAADAGTVAALPAYTVTGSGQILTGNVNGAIPSATTDNVTLTANQRLLVKNETSTLTPNNGIYVVTQVGSGSLPFILTRSSDANTSALLSEATLGVKNGTTLANTQWHCNPAAIPIIIGTTNITFAQIGGGNYTFSPPLAVAGNIVSIPPATSSVDGYLTASDHLLFSGKQDALTDTKSVKIVSNNVELDGDLTTPLANYVYGTNGAGTRGWKPDPTGGGNSIGELTGDVTAGPASSPSQSVASTLKTNLRIGSCGVTFDGQGGTISNGKTAYVQVPYAGTITGWTLVANVAGNCTVTVFKDTYINYPPTSPTDNIFVTQPALSGVNKQNATGLSVAVTAGDYIGFTISGVLTVSWVNLTLTINKT
jgi:hypothetical protein